MKNSLVTLNHYKNSIFVNQFIKNLKVNTMKKVILSAFVVASLLATSCKKEKEAAKEVEKTVVEAVTETVEATEDATTKAVDTVVEEVKSVIDGVAIPEFKDPKVGEFLQSYSQYAKDYIDAKGDVLKNAKLAKKGVEYATKAKEIVGNLDADAAKKFKSVMSAIQSKMAPAK